MRGTGTSYLYPALGTLLEGCHDIACTCFPVAYTAPACSNLFDLSIFTVLMLYFFASVSHYMYLSCPCMSTCHEVRHYSSHFDEQVRVDIQLLQKLRQRINMTSSDCLLLILTPGIAACVADCMHTLHSSQIPGAAEEIQPMLFTESASTPTVSSTPFTLAPPRSCESKSCDFLLWNICLLICPWVISKLPHTYYISTPE